MNKVVTLTKQEVINQLKPIISEIIIDSLDDYINGGPNYVGHSGINAFNKYYNLKDNIPTLIQIWCDHVSDKYFDDHPDVSDVLLLIEAPTENAPSTKEWMASRE